RLATCTKLHQLAAEKNSGASRIPGGAVRSASMNREPGILNRPPMSPCNSCNPFNHVTRAAHMPNTTRFPLFVLFGVIWRSLVLFGPKNIFVFFDSTARHE
ncbi:MAG TPA: hypothetical protein VK850_13450, partial [Candidatus Binatia bacterium]|nr:hypothetical protein [Candidatus Binatia bacterium]